MKSSDISEPPAAGRAKKRTTAILLTTVKWALFLIVLFYVGRALWHQFAKVSWNEIRPAPLLAVLAVVVVLMAKAMSFLLYGLLLRRFGKFPGWLPMMCSVWTAQLGKYAPGKVGAVVGMVWLLRRYNVPGQIAVGTVFIIDGLSVILGMMVAVPLTLWGPVRAVLPMAWLWCSLVLVIGTVCLHPRVFGTVGNFLLRKFGYQPLPMLPTIRDYVWPIVVMLVQFTLLGLGYWLMTRSIAPVSIRLLPMFISGVVLVVIGGFLAFFAPAGLGVQEGLLLILLKPFIGATAAIIAVAMRFVQVVSDVLLALAGLIILRLTRNAQVTKNQMGQCDTL